METCSTDAVCNDCGDNIVRIKYLYNKKGDNNLPRVMVHHLESWEESWMTR